MTVAEKAAQLGSVNADRILTEDGEIDWNAVDDHLGDGIGHLTRIGGEGSLDPEPAARVTEQLQEYLIEETRLGVPAIPHEECLSGYMGPEATTFPQMIGMASTWNPDLLESVTTAIRGELQAIGTVHALSPVLDLARDLRWGRVEETFGEDPYLVAEMARSYVDGLQGDGIHDGISATLKHFAGHGATDGGKNRSSLATGPRELRELHLFPYEATIDATDAESVMNAYHDIDGVPCASSEWLLTDVLRGEFDFDGTVVSDYYSIDLLREEHGVTATDRDSGVAALEAGIDVELPYTDCYGDHLVEAVERGELAEETLDESVRRVLRMKFEKGVVDEWSVDPETAADAFQTDASVDLARTAAEESLVLLKNEDDLLPLTDADSVAVVGPKADDKMELLGDYAYAAHYPQEEYASDAVTPLSALSERAEEEGLDITHAPGCTTTGPETDQFDEATAAAADADVAVAFVGARSAVDFSEVEDAKRERSSVPTSGEGCDVTDLDLPGVQEDLVLRLTETDTPVVVVIVSGKPHSIEAIDEKAPAILHAWLPGDQGGPAIVDALFGDISPGGRLPVSVPKSVGQLPVYYNRKPNTAAKEYVYTDANPLYAFGHGLTYSTVEYGEVEVSAETIDPMDTVTVSVPVTNAGDRAVDEVVQLYSHAETPSLARPVQELLGFDRVSLDAGERRTVTFEVSATQLAFHDRNVDLVVEDGDYELRVGRAADRIEDAVTLTVSETKPVPRTGRRYYTATAVDE
ncbi:glycoside hydrolase family 3 N-terminal domain-containing protein [Halorubrum gandharaense]